MLKSITVKNCFTHINRTIEFDEGLTCITGPNEAGKSLILEMIAYALFGTKALRGSRPDALFVDLSFEVKGVGYRVIRDGSKPKLLRDGAELAVGTKPVNAAIARALGYDYTVFTMGNLCAQGQIEALGNMKPAERKRAVDQTIGLTALDSLTKWAGEEAATLARQAEAVERMLREPTEPAQPEGYRPSTELRGEKEQAAADLRELLEIDALLKTQPTIPAEPTDPYPGEDLADIEKTVADRNAAAQMVATYKAQVDAIPDAAFTEAEVEAMEERQAICRQLAGVAEPAIPLAEAEQMLVDWERWESIADSRRIVEGLIEPTLTEEEVLALRTQWGAYDRWMRKQYLEKHLQTCPACNHQWATGNEGGWEEVKDAPETTKPRWSWDALCREDNRVVAWATNKADRELAAATPKPTVSKITVESELFRWELWNKTKPLRDRLAELPGEGIDPAPHRRALAEADRKAGLQQTLEMRASTFARLPDRSADVLAKRKWVVEHQAYDAAVARYRDWTAKAEVKYLRKAEIADAEPRLRQLQIAYDAAVLYEQAVAQFNKEREAWISGMEQAADLRIQAEGWTNAKKALVDLRGRVKAYLLPSLNKVASFLLAQMTNGKRGDIKVDEDFEVLVDGQPINTLSGSGKAVANLALRIGLGLVLTNRMFSVFMGDELDGSMDAERAQATMTALANLTNTIKQVVVISHKQLDADQYVELGEAA